MSDGDEQPPDPREVELRERVARAMVVVLREFTDRLGLDPDAPEVREACRAALHFMAEHWDLENGTWNAK